MRGLEPLSNFHLVAVEQSTGEGNALPPARDMLSCLVIALARATAAECQRQADGRADGQMERGARDGGRRDRGVYKAAMAWQSWRRIRGKLQGPAVLKLQAHSQAAGALEGYHSQDTRGWKWMPAAQSKVGGRRCPPCNTIKRGSVLHLTMGLEEGGGGVLTR